MVQFLEINKYVHAFILIDLCEFYRQDMDVDQEP